MKKILLSVTALLVSLFVMSQGKFARSSDPKVAHAEANRKTSAPYSVLFREGSNLKLSDAQNILSKYVGLRQGTDELRLKTSDAGKDNITVNRYQQYFKNIKVEHGTYVATAKNGNIAFINGDFYSLKTNIETTPQLNEAAALAKALESVGAKKYQWEMPEQEAFLKKETNDPLATYYPKGELVFVEDYNTGKELTGKVTLAYKFDVYASAPESRNYIYIDAKTGKVLLTDAILKHANDETNGTPTGNAASASNGWGIFRNTDQNEQPIINSPTVVGTASTMYSGTVSIPTQLVAGTHILQSAVATENYPLHTRNLRNSTTDFAGATEFTDIDNNWTTAEFNNATFDQVALDAHWGAAKVYDYWKTKHARNSYDNANSVINSYVHWGTNVNNAGWDGVQMKYGDGTRVNGGFSPLGAVDVCAHEIGHAVCTYTSDLVYARESGAMNEGFSDIWGAAIEHFADPHETDAAPKSYFLIGEEIGLPVPNNPLRSMSNPKAEGQPDTYLGTNWVPATASACPTPGAGNDQCGVHTNSGVLNHWFFILVQGKTGTNDVGFSYNVTGIGWDDAEKLTYLTEQNLTASADYKACRTASYNAAVILFGACDSRTATVLKAWDAVNVLGVAIEPLLTLTQNVTQQNEGLNVTYTNTLTSPCPTIPYANYVLTDTIPSTATFVSATNGGTLTGNVVKWAVNLAGGETKQYSFTVTVKPGSYFPTVDLINEPVAGTTIPAGWTATTVAPAGGTPWVSSTVKSHSAPNSLFGVDRIDVASDMMVSTNAASSLGTTPFILSFWHDYNTEGGWDGGVVEISTNGAGGPWNDLGNYMSLNGYNSTLGTGSNLANRAAFSGNSGGFIQTKIKLNAFAGQNALFRFRCASDDNTAPTGGGWYVDDILLRTQALIDIRSNLFNTGGTRVGVADTSTIILPNLGCPIIVTQPSNTTVCNSSTATFTVTASGSNMTYKWQESTNGGGAWNDLTALPPYAGVATATLTINPAILTMNNNQYRCIISNPGCTAGATSSPAILTVVLASVGGNVTPAVNAACGTTNSGTLTLAGQVGNVIRWEFNTTSATGPTWTAIANTTTTHTYTNLTQTTWFRAVVMVSGCVQTTSSVAVVNFTAANAMLIIADPGTTLCAGDPTRLTVMEQAPPVAATANCSSSNTGTAGSIACGNILTTQVNSFFRVYNLSAFPAITGNYTINSVTFGIESATGGAQNITVVLYDQTGAAFPGGTRTQIATQTVSIANQANTLFTANLATPVTVSNTQTIILEVRNSGTANRRFFIGSNAAAECGPSFIQAAGCNIATPTTLAAAGFPNMHVIAFLNGTVPGIGAMVTGGTFAWTPAAGLSSITTNPVAASPASTTTYTVNHNNGAGCTRQANITITVNQRPVVTTAPSSTNVCEGGTTTFSAATAGTGATVKWQFSTTGAGGTFNDVPAAAPYSGVTTNTLTVGPATMAMNGYAFRIVVTGTCTPVANSTAAILTINPAPAISFNVASPVCGGVAGINGTMLTATSATGGNFTWAPATGLYTNANATTAYVAGTAMATVYAAPATNTVYTATATNSTTGCKGTGTITVNYTPAVPVVTPGGATICSTTPKTYQQLQITSALAGSSTQGFTSGPINVAIPEGVFPGPVYAGATSDIPVTLPTGSVISKVDVTMNITHAFVGDVVASLKAPNGKIICLDALLTATNNSGANFVNTIISSAGTTALSAGTAPFSNTFKADNQFVGTFNIGTFTLPTGPTGFASNTSLWNDLYGNPNGNWTLALYDAGDPNQGTLTSWAINFTYAAPTPGIWSVAGAPADFTGLFNDAAGASAYTGTSQNIVYASPATTTTYQVTVANGTCTSQPRTIPVVVNTPINITAQPVNDTTCTNGVATFTVGTSGTTPNHNWRESTDAGATWTNLVDGGVYSGVKTATLTITNPPISMSGNWYRDSITAAPCATVVSKDTAMLVVNPLPVVSISAAPYTTLLPGLTTTLTAASNPQGSQYQWYRDGVAVGANASTIQVDVDGLGLYTVIVGDINGCGSSSNSILISDSSSGRVFIYPNPNSGIFQVRYHSGLRNTNLPRGMNIYDDKGARVLMQQYSINGAYGRMDVDLRKYGTGTYWVEVVDANGDRLAVGRVIIIR